MNDTAKVRVIRANNPSPLTGPGTNSFLVGRGRIAVIDPGPDLPDHVDAILSAAQGGRITHIIVTHAHRDHSEAAPRLAAATGAPILGFGAATAGRSPTMEHLAGQGLIAGGEGMDAGFRPDIPLPDGAVVESDEWRLTARHTPGHMGNHICLALDDTIFCGDLVMGWSTTLISPPDGDLADYFRSLALLETLTPRRLLPAHGNAVRDPAARLAELAAHRRNRTAQILAALDESPATAAELARRIYNVVPTLLPAAARNALAHLIALSDLGAAAPEPFLSEAAVWHRTRP